jgi:3-deoxy-D-manno-octulosonate 8-phosphate phosphatase (KDO 8-P phosphatase)
MRRVGFAIAVQNAHIFVKQHCDWVTTAHGGNGAVREVTDFILQAQSLLAARQDSYLE